MLLSGLMMPYDILSASAQTFARLFPATYGMIGYKQLAYSGYPGTQGIAAIIILLTGGLLAFGLAIMMFNWDRHNTTRRFHPALALLALLPYIAGIIFLG
jgi:ABC-type polysaccharide/polyol phosphate export permease